MLSQGDDEVIHCVPDFLVKRAVFSTKRADGFAVVYPEHGACGKPHEVEYACPDHAESLPRYRHPVFMECDVSGLISDHEPAHLGDGFVFPSSVFEHHLVVNITDYFC